MPKSEFPPEEGQDRFRGILVSDLAWNDQNRFNSLTVDLTFSDSLTVSGWVAGVGGNAALGTGSESRAARRSSDWIFNRAAVCCGGGINSQPHALRVSGAFDQGSGICPTGRGGCVKSQTSRTGIHPRGPGFILAAGRVAVDFAGCRRGNRLGVPTTDPRFCGGVGQRAFFVRPQFVRGF